MKQFSQQLHKKATTTVKLQAAESRELRERLVAYMEYHPLPAEMRAQKKAPTTILPAEPFTVVKLPLHAFFKYGAAFAAVILVAVPFLAEKAVPGDALYSVKVQFNEEIRGTLTFDSFQKVEWETERLNRRIAEARLLASEGRLTEEVEAEVADAVRTHTENAKREIEVLRAEDVDEAQIASIALDTTLEVQSTSLKNENSSEAAFAATTTRSVSLIATALDESRGSTEVNTASSTPAYGKLIARVEQNTTRIYELHDQLREVVSEQEMSEVDRRVADIERSIVAAVAMAVEDEVGARQSLVDVLQRTQRLIVFMTEIEVSETVDIETLVPVMLTDIEKQNIIASSTKEIAATIEKISMQMKKIEDQEVVDKIAAGQTAVMELAAKMATSTEDFKSFVSFYEDALAVVDDIEVLLERYAESIEVPVSDDVSTSTEETASSTEVVTSSTSAVASSTVTNVEIENEVASGSVEIASSTEGEETIDSSS